MIENLMLSAETTKDIQFEKYFDLKNFNEDTILLFGNGSDFSQLYFPKIYQILEKDYEKQFKGYIFKVLERYQKFHFKPDFLEGVENFGEIFDKIKQKGIKLNSKTISELKQLTNAFKINSDFHLFNLIARFLNNNKENLVYDEPAAQIFLMVANEKWFKNMSWSEALFQNNLKILECLKKWDNENNGNVVCFFKKLMLDAYNYKYFEDCLRLEFLDILRNSFLVSICNFNFENIDESINLKTYNYKTIRLIELNNENKINDEEKNITEGINTVNNEEFKLNYKKKGFFTRKKILISSVCVLVAFGIVVVIYIILL